MAGLIALALAGPARGVPLLTHESGPRPGILVSIGSHQLHINCTGEGVPAVVFESGLGGTSLDWTKVQPAVSEFTRACSYDRAGYGWSEFGPLPRHAVRIAAELDKLLVYASVPPPYVLVGHSFGGLTIRAFATRKARGAVAGMVFVDAAHEEQFERIAAAGVPVPMAPTGRKFVIANRWAVPSGLPVGTKPLARRLALTPKAVRTLYSELGMLRYSALQIGSIRRNSESPVIVLARAHRRDAASTRTTRLEGTWIDLQRDLARSMNGAALQVVAGSGHYIHLDRPERVVTAIRTMIDGYRLARESDVRPSSRRRARRECCNE